MMTNDAATRREIALKLIRVNLHGASWKIETERFDEARVTLNAYINACKKAKAIDAIARACREVLRDLDALQKAARMSEQSECMKEDADRGRYLYGD